MKRKAPVCIACRKAHGGKCARPRRTFLQRALDYQRLLLADRKAV